MTRAQELLAQLETVVQSLKVEIETAQTVRVSTAAELIAALAVGGNIQLLRGTFSGNFTVTKPTTLVGERDAVLTPLDLLTPTLSVRSSDVSLSGFTIRNGAPDRDCVIVGSFTATDALLQPARVVLDGLSIEAGTKGGHRGIALHGSHHTVKHCRVTGFWEAGRDSQAIWAHNGPGPYVIEDNYLEASGETILLGGDRVKIPNCVPEDVIIRRNTCYKPDAWRTNGSTVKNSIEVKNGRRVLIEDNVCDGNWRSGQDGNPIVITVRNQYGDTPWVVVDDITVRGNVTRRCKDGYALAILGFDGNYTSQQSQTIRIEHNLFADSPNGFKIGNGVQASLIIRNNTLPAVTGNLMQLYDTRTVPVKSPLTFTANVAKSGAYGISGTNAGVGLPSLLAYTTLVDVSGNVLEKSAERNIPYPPGNTLVEPGGLQALIDPVTFKLRNGQAGY